MLEIFNLPWNNTSLSERYINDLIITMGYRYDPYYYENVSQKYEKEMKSYLDAIDEKGGTMDGDLIQTKWFFNEEPDIFLSHTGKDENLALMIKFLLELNGISVFVDSTAWGSINYLQKLIDDRFCKRKDGYYSYEKRNNTTAAIHMLLASSLTQVMNSSQYVFFLNTSNSNLKDAYYAEEVTDSPWIYHELSMAKMIWENRQRPILEHRALDSAGKIIRKLDLKDFKVLEVNYFCNIISRSWYLKDKIMEGFRKA